MVAGLKTLEILGRDGAYEYLDKITGRLIAGILQAGRDAGHAVEGGHISGAVGHGNHTKRKIPFLSFCDFLRANTNESHLRRPIKGILRHPNLMLPPLYLCGKTASAAASVSGTCFSTEYISSSGPAATSPQTKRYPPGPLICFLACSCSHVRLLLCGGRPLHQLRGRGGARRRRQVCALAPRHAGARRLPGAQPGAGVDCLGIRVSLNSTLKPQDVAAAG